MEWYDSMQEVSVVFTQEGSLQVIHFDQGKYAKFVAEGLDSCCGGWSRKESSILCTKSLGHTELKSKSVASNARAVAALMFHFEM